MIQKNFFAGVGALSLLAGLASAGGSDILVITEVVDGPLVGGLPKWVELQNGGTTVIDLTDFSIGSYNNGNTTLFGLSSTILSGTLTPGDTYVLSYENSDGPGLGSFFDVYGVDPSNYDLGPSINGNDVIALFLADGAGPNGEATGTGSDATLVDVYGVIGDDGVGEVWEYTDSYAFRCGDAPNATFDPADWTFGGPDALEAGCGGSDACETMNLQELTTPFLRLPCTLGDVYCFGDGSGTACPCANPGAPGEGCANGTGNGGVLVASGSASISAADLVLNGSNLLPNQPGLFFQGDSSVNGGNGIAFGDGLRCAGSNVERLQIRFPDANGDASTTVNIAVTGGVSAGETKSYQLWYRDPASSPCGFLFNLTNGVELTWVP